MGDPAAREAVVDGVLLALSHSSLRPDDALRDILMVDYRDLTAEGVLDLEVLWSLLAEHPNFDADGAVAPMCVIKSWESRLGMDVRLPEKLQSFSDKDIALKVAECIVPKGEVARALREPAERARRTSMSQEARPAARPRASWRERGSIGLAAGVVFAAAMVYLAISTLKECGTGQWERINAADHAAGIPISGAEELGKQVAFQLSETEWLSAPADERKQQMEQALRSLESRGTRTLVVRDASGNVRATAQWYAGRTKIKVRLK